MADMKGANGRERNERRKDGLAPMELGRRGWVPYARPLARLQASTGATQGQQLLLDPVELLDRGGVLNLL